MGCDCYIQMCKTILRFYCDIMVIILYVVYQTLVPKVSSRADSKARSWFPQSSASGEQNGLQQSWCG